ncbi:MAG: adenosylcobinamide-GDP ribazoletransferase [Silicimonas sp.]|nr:adenosylcobinamide-GDP ribazoletransferase [Silicimonas sp.]
MGQRLSEAQVALALLTRLPSGALPTPAPSHADAAWAFPLVGMIVGAISGAVFLLAGAILPGLPAALLAISTAVVVTGALHEDGLADVADGFGGGQEPARKLEIMADSRIGSYGVVALVLTLGLIASAQSALPATTGTVVLFAAIGALSRSAMLAPMVFLKPARDSGLGASARLAKGWRVWIGLGIGALLALFTLPALLIAALVGAIVMMWLAKAQIGGQTGDVLGATQKLTETLGWMAAAALVT